MFKKIFATLVMVLAMLPAAMAAAPDLGNVQGQTVQCNEAFSTIDLASMTSDADTPISELKFNSYDSYDLEVSISNGIATISNPGFSRTEFIGFRVTDPEGGTDTKRAEFTVTGCEGPDLGDNFTIPEVEAPWRFPGFEGFGDFQYFGNSFFPDNFITHPPGTCAISTGHGLLDDLDCDQVPDRADNCPDIPNPQQRDQNRNGRGDACDVVVAGVEIQPDKLSCGGAALVTASVVNNQDVPFSNVRVKLVSEDLNVESTEYIKFMGPGSAKQIELTSRIPLKADPGLHNINVIAEYFEAGRRAGTGASMRVKISDEDSCKQSPERSFVDVQEIEDVRIGESAVFPVKVTNTNEEAKSYEFKAEGVGDFGTYMVSPGSLVIIKPGETETVYLTVTPDGDARTGSRTFTLEVREDDEAEQVTLVANVLEGEEKSTAFLPIAGQVIGIIALVAFIAFIISRREEIRGRLALDTRGEKRKGLGQLKVGQFENPDRQKVAEIGVEKERGWLYYVDKQGDVSRSRMKWAKSS